MWSMPSWWSRRLRHQPTSAQSRNPPPPCLPPPASLICTPARCRPRCAPHPPCRRSGRGARVPHGVDRRPAGGGDGRQLRLRGATRFNCQGLGHRAHRRQARGPDGRHHGPRGHDRGGLPHGDDRGVMAASGCRSWRPTPVACVSIGMGARSHPQRCQGQGASSLSGLRKPVAMVRIC